MEEKEKKGYERRKKGKQQCIEEIWEGKNDDGEKMGVKNYF